MCSIPALYDFAIEQNIDVLEFSMPLNGSMSVMSDSGHCCIGMDPTIIDGNAEERVHLGHELGHCVTGSFYSIHTAIDSRQRHENKADKWAIRKLIPLDDFDEAIDAGCAAVWELAEHFGVTERFMKKAICLYAHGNVAEELYF